MRAGGRKDRRRLERRGLGERLGDALRWRLGQRPTWHVALARGDWREVDRARGSLVPNPPGGYLADPFLCEWNGELVLFAEEFRWAERRGLISAYRLESGKPERIGPVLSERFHLSFPFTFAHDGALWMAPECTASGGLRVYRCRDFPAGWVLETVLLPEERLADPMLFPHEGRWWLLATRGDAGGQFFGRLCAWHADGPLGPWTEHAANPVVLDRTRGRNGGLLWADGVPHRVGQRQGADVYGRGLGVYRIEELTPEAYGETSVTPLDRHRLRRVRAAHHLSAGGGWTAWDLSRWGWPR